MTDHSNEFNPADIQANKSISVLCYFGFLFIIPMIRAKNSPYAKFHINQGLVLFVFEVGLNLLTRIMDALSFNSAIKMMMIPVHTVFAVVNVLLLVFVVMGIINCIYGQAKELPLIGKIRLYK